MGKYNDSGRAPRFVRRTLSTATSEEEVKNITRLCPPKTCSLDSCPSNLLKKTVGVCIPCLVAIVNNGVKQGLFPINLRTAIVKPLLKSDTRQRPVKELVSYIAFVGSLGESCSSLFA